MPDWQIGTYVADYVSTGITRTVINQLKRAELVCFRHTPPAGTIEFGSGASAFLQTLTVGSTIKSFYDGPKTFAFEGLTVPLHDEVWQTFLSLLRPSDRVSLYWKASNSNGYTKDAGLYRDELYIIVDRHRGAKGVTLRFFLSVSICPDNTARMIRKVSAW